MTSAAIFCEVQPCVGVKPSFSITSSVKFQLSQLGNKFLISVAFFMRKDFETVFRILFL